MRVLVEGTNIVRRELGLPEAHIRAADPRLYLRMSVRLGRMARSHRIGALCAEDGQK
jgi:hypothetical protein